MPKAIGYDSGGISIVIVKSQDFPNELYDKVKKLLLEYLETRHVGLIFAIGTSDSMIGRLFEELELQYPSVLFGFVASEDFLRGADVVICRQYSKFDDANQVRFKTLNPRVEHIIFR